MRVAEIVVVEDRTARARLDEGFLRLKRLQARNRREDGSLSPEYPIDLIDRPTLDAVAESSDAATTPPPPVIDSEPPSLTCPQNIFAAEHPPGSGGDTVTFAVPTLAISAARIWACNKEGLI